MIKIIYFLVFLIPTLSQADLYKCSNKNKVVFQDKPCQNDYKGSQIDIPKTSTFTSADIPIKHNERNKIVNAQQNAYEESRLKKIQMEIEAKRKSLQCNILSHNLNLLKKPRPVYSTDDNGERHFVEDNAREAEIEKTQLEFDQNCK
jgi:hypothetical protein